MDPEIVEEIAEKIYRRFPEVEGIWPKVRKQPVPKEQKRPTGSAVVYLLTFNTTVRTGSGAKLPYWVRVAAKANGRIIKTTTSK